MRINLLKVDIMEVLGNGFADIGRQEGDIVSTKRKTFS